MNEFTYSHYDPDELILRDHLAIDRTVLANERTLLAYIRTALALFVIGITFAHFLKQWLFLAIGGFLGLLGFILLVVGAVHFFRTRARIAAIQSSSKGNPSEKRARFRERGERHSRTAAQERPNQVSASREILSS